MTHVTCGIKAFDPHELLCHAVAERRGYYADEGLSVRLRDTTFTPDADLPTTSFVQVACGAAALGRKAGYPWKVVFAGVDRPLFWVYGTVRELSGARIAGYPLGSPPDVFLREAVGAAEVEIMPSASDPMRLGLARSGAVDAAVLSSAVAAPEDLERLLFVGDHVRAVTTGIAVHEQALDDDRALVAAVVRAHARSLDAIHALSDDVVATMAEVFGLDHSRLGDMEPCFTQEGRADVSRDPDLFDFSLVP